MPTYEFRCPDGTIIERIFKISEAPTEIPSPKGDGMAVRIISGGAALLFKGSGFYITDYGKDGKKDQRTAGANETTPSSGSKDPASDRGESKGTGATDSTPAGKADATGSAKPADSKPAATPPASPNSD